MTWESVPLGRVLPFRYGKGLPERNRTGTGQYSVVSSAGFTGTHDTALTQGPSVVIGRKGTIGAAYYCEQPVWPIDTTFYVEPSELIDIRFAYYLVSSLPLREMNNDSAVPGLNRTHAESLQILLPPMPEQRAIAATLGAFDDKIESNRRVIGAIADLLDAQSELHGRNLPTVPLGELTVSLKDSVIPSKLGDSIVDHFSLPAFDSGAHPERVAAFSIMSNKLRVPEHAVLLSRLNPRFNRTWWASTHADTPALASTEFLVLTSDDEQQLAAVWLAVRNLYFREQLPKRVTGTSGSHQRVRPDDVLSIEVPDFSKTHETIKQGALDLLERAAALRAETERLVALRNTFLPELLSGRVCALSRERQHE